jgi:hypothetical protein
MAHTGIHFGLKQENKHPLDGRTYYETIEEALADNPYTVTPSPTPLDPSRTIIETTRFIGQKMVIVNPPNSDSPCEYWFKDGITNGDLVEYVSDDSYHWEKVDAFGGGGGNGGGGSGGGVSIGTVSLSNVSYLTDVAMKSKVLGFANDSHKLVYFTINATISNNSSLSNSSVGTLSVAPTANTAISVFCCANSFLNAKGRIMSNGNIEITGSMANGFVSFSSDIVISGCFVTNAT